MSLLGILPSPLSMLHIPSCIICARALVIEIRWLDLIRLVCDLSPLPGIEGVLI